MAVLKVLQEAICESCLTNGVDASKDEIISDIPRKWEKHGDMVLFPSDAFTFIAKHLSTDILWKTVADCMKVKRVAVQDSIRSNDFRSPYVSLKYGTDTWVTHIDNKIKYSFDVTKCMFSSGNITEKIRMGKLKCKDETVVDMFTGIGYFTLPILVHGKAAMVHACEWNPHAVEALRYNLRQNKVEHKCIVHEGDNRKVCPVGVADRVLLGLIPSAEESLFTACRALKPNTGGVMHVHANVTSQSAKEDSDLTPDTALPIPTCNRKLKNAWLLWAHDLCARIKDFLESFDEEQTWTVTCFHVERVKSYAPKIDHLVADISCIPSTAKR